MMIVMMHSDVMIMMIMFLFQLVHCAVELAPPSVSPARAALVLGRANKPNISCSLLDTTQDAR